MIIFLALVCGYFLGILTMAMFVAGRDIDEL